MIKEFKEKLFGLFTKPFKSVSRKNNRKYRNLLLKSLPEDKEKRAKSLIKELNNLSAFKNIDEFFNKSNELNNLVKEAIDKSDTKLVNKVFRRKESTQLIDTSNQNYTPAISGLYQLFRNPFGIYKYLMQNHWAVETSINVIRREIANDGYIIRAKKGTTKKRLKDIHDILVKTGIPELRIKICSHIKLYGNCWILPEGKSIKILSPPRMLPISDPISDKIIGWKYIDGHSTKTYRLDQLFHLWQYSSDDYSGMGDPPLAPALVDIEADLAASNFNNLVFQKGGLLGIILSIDPPISDLDDDPEEIVEELQDRIDAQYSGMQSGQSVLVASHLKNVYNVSPVGKLDSSFSSQRQETAKTIANCLGVPPEKIAVNRSDNLQYVPAFVEHSINSAFDKEITALTTLVDDFINEKIIKGIFKITDARIEAGGRFGSLTKTAAETVKILADAGPLLTVNQALEWILGFEPVSPDNERGQIVLDNSANRDSNSNPPIIDPEKIDLYLSMIKNPESLSQLKDFIDRSYKPILENLTNSFKTIRKKDYIDRTNAEDTDTANVAIIKRGRIRFYEELH
jgi:hypothetical protein